MEQESATPAARDTAWIPNCFSFYFQWKWITNRNVLLLKSENRTNAQKVSMEAAPEASCPPAALAQCRAGCSPPSPPCTCPTQRGNSIYHDKRVGHRATLDPPQLRLEAVASWSPADSSPRGRARVGEDTGWETTLRNARRLVLRTSTHFQVHGE